MSVDRDPVGRTASAGGKLASNGIATVCLSGGLSDKLLAASAAGFDCIELFEPDLIACNWSPTEIRQRCVDLGLRIALYQPFRDFEGVRAEVFAANMRRARRKFALIQSLGADMLLVCSNTMSDSSGDPELCARQLRELAQMADDYGIRVAYEALAWGRHVSDWRTSYDLVRLVDHRALGICLDSFHVLSVSPPESVDDIESIQPGSIFFLQLADAPRLSMDVLSWSRHHRVFPGQGSLDLGRFTSAVLAAGYEGPLSLEVFNDTFRQAGPKSTAVDAMRSLMYLRQLLKESDPTSPTLGRARPELTGISSVEIVSTGDAADIRRVIRGMGFERLGSPSIVDSAESESWQRAGALLTVTAVPADTSHGATLGTIVLRSTDASRSRSLSAALASARHPDATDPAKQDKAAVVKLPCGCGITYIDEPARITPDAALAAGTHPASVSMWIDHVALNEPFDRYNEALLLIRSALGLEVAAAAEDANPFGIRRRTILESDNRLVCLSLGGSLVRTGDWSSEDPEPQHIALGVDDVFAAHDRALRDGVQILRVPANYYEDLQARTMFTEQQIDELRTRNIFYDGDAGGHRAVMHFCTEMMARSTLYFEVLQRVGGFRGQGTNGPVRAAAQAASR